MSLPGLTPRKFKIQAQAALADPVLRGALGRARSGFVDKRARAVAAVPEFEALRDEARDLKRHALARLDSLLERYEAEVTAAGGHVHWAETAEDACRLIVDLCARAGARKIAKGKSMAGEEVALNAALEGAGFEVIETDLGEYIIQLADEPPSHIIAPAVHKTREQIAHLFRQHHADLDEDLTEIPDLVNEARRVLRQQFLSADVGITGANLLIADTGSHVLVTNEGNGDLSSTCPRVHIVIAGIEKVVPDFAAAATVLRVLARSATGQAITSYTSVFSGPRRADDLDGPEAFHVVLLDNGRSDMLGSEFREMLRCIRCGACLNHCPVYTAVGGHAYGAVYPGPMGSVLTPLQWGLREAGDLPNACTLNGRCATVCPVRIPLPDLLRRLRSRAHRDALDGARNRRLLAAWVWLARRPGWYRRLSGLGVRVLRWLGRGKGRVSRLPLAAGWTGGRDLPLPEGRTFFEQYRKGRRA
ncbi:MAG: LutB/LldF family L-lactate oxidation iron-sulfur protein [Gammaproteobacteria bacterium]